MVYGAVGAEGAGLRRGLPPYNQPVIGSGRLRECCAPQWGLEQNCKSWPISAYTLIYLFVYLFVTTAVGIRWHKLNGCSLLRRVPHNTSGDEGKGRSNDVYAA